MADSSTEASSVTPIRPQATIVTTLQEDERNCVRVVLHHLRVLLLYMSSQIALALETFYI